MEELIFATQNRHKVDEISLKLKGDIAIKSLLDLNYMAEIIENGDTLEENALIKARTIYKEFDKNCFSEDTGLEVKVLDNAPGVRTARYAGPSKSAESNMNLLLKNLEPHQDRTARFRAIIALIYRDKEYLFEGITEGAIAKKKKGIKGFGYDPIFIPKGYTQSFAELGEEVKISLSHRSRAFEKMIDWLQRIEN